MEELQYSHRKWIPFSLFLILTIQLSSLPLLSEADYTLPDHYFINCGSSNITKFAERSFVGDVSFYTVPSKAVKDSSSSAAAPLLYQTARIFSRKKSSYSFNINESGTYMVRLHFYAFTSSYDLKGAVFNVRAASGFLLLSKFRVPQGSDSPVIKEFLLPIELGNLRIDFILCHGSSLAFVNAIEVFLAPESFLPDQATHITYAGSSGNYSRLLTQALHTIYRINVGGSKLTADSDTLLRTWIPDDEFLLNPEAANKSSYADTVNYRTGTGLATKYIAPEPVYRTDKVLNADENKGSNFSNLTWSFRVNNTDGYLLRLHFYDIISPSPDVLWFYVRINNRFSKEIRPYNITDPTSSPFYIDFVVDSGGSEFMNLSIVRDSESLMKSAFLNGLEIMAIMKRSSKKNILMVGLLSGGAFIMISLIVVLLLAWKRNRVGSSRTSGRLFSALIHGGSSGSASINSDLKLALTIPYWEIKRATKNFHQKLLIGEGGFGKVYRGTLSEGVNVAVKRSQPGHGQGLREFQTEVIVLSSIRHRHLVSLIGYCDQRSEMILVYEFMEKGTLRGHLYESDSDSGRYSSRCELSWEQRLQICIDAAKGLHYLHSGLGRTIIHRDVKTTNILLDEHLTAKVADFGLSKSGPLDPDQEETGVKGSFGYLDPEYLMTLQYTDKSDVYSFGVVLLEVLCARPAIIDSDHREEINLGEWGMLWHRKGQLEKIVDPFLEGINSVSLRKFGETAEKCLRANSVERPTMREVLWDLEFTLQLQQAAMHRQPYDDSMINSSSEFALRVGDGLPSRFFSVEEKDNSSLTMARTGEFSQQRTDSGG